MTAGRNISIESLTEFSVSPCGSFIEIGYLTNGAKRPERLVLPLEMLSALLLTLPSVIDTAVQRKSGSSRTRHVYPLGEWRVESAMHEQDVVLLTLSTPDGFRVTFNVRSMQAACLGRTLAAAALHEDVTKPNAQAIH